MGGDRTETLSRPREESRAGENGCDDLGGDEEQNGCGDDLFVDGAGSLVA